MKGRVLITEKEDEEMSSIKRSRMFRLVFISVLFLGFTVHLATAPPVGAKMRLTLGTSTIGGTWYVTGTGLAELWNKEIPEITVTLGGGGSGGNNPKLLAKRIESLISDSDLCNKIVANAREMVNSQFSIGKMTEEYMANYDELM